MSAFGQGSIKQGGWADASPRSFFLGGGGDCRAGLAIFVADSVFVIQQQHTKERECALGLSPSQLFRHNMKC